MTSEQKAKLPDHWVPIRQSLTPSIWLMAEKIGGLVALFTAFWYAEGDVWHKQGCLVDVSAEDIATMQGILS